MESVYHIVAIRVNETSWAHVWRLRSRYLGTGYDTETPKPQECMRLLWYWWWPVLSNTCYLRPELCGYFLRSKAR
jgi:hypothetical protein